jgi:hypothetical protein
MMLDELIPFGSPEYFLFFSFLIFGRSMDFFSTWLATPNLVLEANPLARKMGWRWGLIANGIICVWFGRWPLPAIVIVTTSLLVAARNFQSAWLMRSMGELEYRMWMSDRIRTTPRGLFFFCLGAQSSFYALLGAALVLFSDTRLVPFGIGVGMLTYSVAVAVYSTISVWRVRSR